MDDPNAFFAEIKASHGLKFDDLILVYRQFCKNEDVKDSPEAKKELVALPIDLASGSRVTDRRAGAFTEWFRVRNGQIADTRYNMVSQYEVASPDENYSYSSGYADGGERGYPYGGYRNYYGSSGGSPFASFFGLFAPQQNYAPPQRPIYPPAARQQQYPSGYTYRGQPRYW